MVRGLHSGAVLAQQYGFKPVCQHVQCLKLLMGSLRQSLELPDHEFPYQCPNNLGDIFLPRHAFFKQRNQIKETGICCFALFPLYLSVSL